MHRINPFGVYPAELHLAGIPSQTSPNPRALSRPTQFPDADSSPLPSNLDDFNGDTGHLLDGPPLSHGPVMPV